MSPARARVALSLRVALTLAACSSRPEPGKVLVLALDGMDPRAVDLLMSEGKMPSFAKLRQGGAYGRLRSQEPMLSPILWTTIATGKPPSEHGIGHWPPVTSQRRKTKALWNIFSEAGRSVGIVGYPTTWPAEIVNGTIVSDRVCASFRVLESVGQAQAATGMVHPADVEREIAPLLRRPDSLTIAETAPYLHVSDQELGRPFDLDDEVIRFKAVLATADSCKRIGLHLWNEKRPDLTMLYIEAPDSSAHLFGHLFRAGELSGELAAQRKKFGDAVEGIYRYADALVGEILAAMDGATTLVVLSDHGFELGTLEDHAGETRDVGHESERSHHVEGVLYLYGKNVKPRALLDRASLADVAPTILVLAGLPPAADMPGRVLAEGLRHAPLTDRVTTYEGGAGGEALAATGPKTTAERDLAAIAFHEGQYRRALQPAVPAVARCADAAHRVGERTRADERPGEARRRDGGARRRRRAPRRLRALRAKSAVAPPGAVAARPSPDRASGADAVTPPAETV